MKTENPFNPFMPESKSGGDQCLAGTGTPKFRFKTGIGYACFLCTASVLTALLICLIFPPRVVLWRGLDVPEARFTPEVNRAADTLKQVDALFAPVATPSNRMIQWRLLFPAIWHSFNLPKTLFLALPHIGCLLVLGMIAHVAYGATGNRLLAVLATALLGASSWFFVSTGWLTYFDSWLVLGLMLVVFAKPQITLTVACLLCPWIDERFVIALPLCLMVRFIYFQRIEEKNYRAMYQDALLAVFATFFYAASRLSMSLCLEDYSLWYLRDQVVPAKLATVPVSRYLEGIWAGIRGGIFFIGLFLCFACAKSPWRWRTVLWLIFLSTLAISLVIAGDLSRSMSVFLSTALAGIVLAAREQPRVLRIALPIVLIIELLLPAKHVVTVFTIPIYSLRTEISMYRKPPDFLTPEFYLLKAIPLANQGKFDKALHFLDNSITLDSKFAPAYLWRASVIAQQGNLSGAIADLDRAIRLDPALADAFYLRGILHQTRNETKNAKLDLMHALQISAPDWPQRSDCNGRISLLNAPPECDAPK